MAGIGQIEIERWFPLLEEDQRSIAASGRPFNRKFSKYVTQTSGCTTMRVGRAKGSADRLPQYIRIVAFRVRSTVTRERKAESVFSSLCKNDRRPLHQLAEAAWRPEKRCLLRSRERSLLCCGALSTRYRAHGWQRLFAGDQAD